MKSSTVLARLLILTVTLGSVVGCKSTPYQSQSVRQPSVVGQTTASDVVNSVSFAFINNRYSLTEVQKQKQNAAVYSALESDYGQVFNWYERDAMGAVKAVHGYPQGSGFCRVIYSLITVKGRSRHFEETACKESGHIGWRFIAKRR